MSYVLFDGTSTVSFDPGYDIKYDSRKVQSTHRTRSGAGYFYKFGDYRHVKFGIEFVSSADMTRVNSWWGANTTLRLFDLNSTVVVSGFLSNASAPIDGHVLPYSDQFQGVIELESY